MAHDQADLVAEAKEQQAGSEQRKQRDSMQERSHPPTSMIEFQCNMLYSDMLGPGGGARATLSHPSRRRAGLGNTHTHKQQQFPAELAKTVG